jgi:cation diffusion facilitator CzcD-associated flavoprotein CzcO
VTPRAQEHLDVVVVGAGLSGIAAAYHLQTRCPDKTFAILEARDSLGGTWDLFRYPGVRSDSDMFTLGFPFRPWSGSRAIADGGSILAYLEETARAYGIDRQIRYRHRVRRAAWSSRDARWTLTVEEGASAAPRELTCRFVILCSGYYDYQEGYTPPFAGRERFRGRIVHPQQWSPDIEYADKRVVVIGSGATAVTLVPELARRAAHVTMLQRSPTWVVALPARDRLVAWLRRRVSAQAAFRFGRWKYIALAQGFYTFSRGYPDVAGRFLLGRVRRSLGGALSVKTHFTPAYRPWDQRLCVVPDGDLFAAIRSGAASVVTDHIESFTECGIALRSGRHLDADLIVTATGLKLRLLGGIDATVDDQPVDPSQLLVYRGLMCSDVPNFAFVTGYTNASWTLKADLAARYICRLLLYMDRHGHTRCVPRRPASPVEESPIIDLTSGYIQRSIDQLPRQGSVAPWRVPQSYARDLVTFELGRIDDPAMEFAGQLQSGTITKSSWVSRAGAPSIRSSASRSSSR